MSSRTPGAALLRLLLPIALAVLASTSALADFGRYENHRLDGNTLVVTTDRGDLRIAAIDDGAFEVHYIEPGIRQLPSFALAHRAGNVATGLSVTETRLEFSVPELTAVISKSPLTIAYVRGDEPLFSEEHGYFAYDTTRGFRFDLDAGEKIMGGGERVVGMDRRGRRLPLYNRASYGYETEAEQMYFSVPAVMSSDRYMIVFDNSASGWLDVGATERDVLSFEAAGGRTAYLAIAGETYPELIANYTDVTGRQPMPPRWSLGNYASRFGYHSEKEARDVVRRYRRAKIPLDSIILDIYWFGPDIQGHMGKLDWDRDAWPNAEDMIADFRRDGVRTITITEPFILTSSSRWDDAVLNDALATNPIGEPRRFDFYFGNTGLVDVFSRPAQDWFWLAYQRLFDQGIAGTWGDLGEPEVHPGDSLHVISETGVVATGDEVHNAYGHLWAQMVYERQVEAFPDTRPVILMRSGFAGSQRYGMIPWTGDVNRSWGGLKPQVELGLSMGLLGLGYTHSDLGGFAGGEVFDKELYLRWLLYGVFQPIYRPHAQEHIAPEPVFHDAETLALARDFIRLRYRLTPYLYTLAFENSVSGMPLMRPLFFEDETNPSFIDRADAYLWGDAFFVHPVTDAGVESVEVELPEGAWFDFWTDERYESGLATIPVSLDTIPVLVRAGAFVPMVAAVMSMDDYSSESLTLHYYADESSLESNARMYEDDGASRTSVEDGAYEILAWAARRDGSDLEISLDRSGGDYAGRPEARDITMVIHNWQHMPRAITFNDERIDLTRRLPRRGAGATHDGDTLTIRVRWTNDNSMLRIDGGSS